MRNIVEKKCQLCYYTAIYCTCVSDSGYLCFIIMCSLKTFKFKCVYAEMNYVGGPI